MAARPAVPRAHWNNPNMWMPRRLNDLFGNCGARFLGHWATMLLTLLADTFLSFNPLEQNANEVFFQCFLVASALTCFLFAFTQQHPQGPPTATSSEAVRTRGSVNDGGAPPSPTSDAVYSPLGGGTPPRRQRGGDVGPSV